MPPMPAVDRRRKAGATLQGVPVKLPDERNGLVFVFRVFEKMSYAMVMRATRPIYVGDVVADALSDVAARAEKGASAPFSFGSRSARRDARAVYRASCRSRNRSTPWTERNFPRRRHRLAAPHARPRRVSPRAAARCCAHSARPPRCSRHPARSSPASPGNRPPPPSSRDPTHRSSTRPCAGSSRGRPSPRDARRRPTIRARSSRSQIRPPSSTRRAGSNLLNVPAFAIVGSRNATAQGERDAQAFARSARRMRD